MTPDQMCAVIQAHKEGKQLQFRPFHSTEWQKVYVPLWNFDEGEYRVVPEPREWWINFYNCGLPPAAHTRLSAAQEGAKRGTSQYHVLEMVHVREVIES